MSSRMSVFLSFLLFSSLAEVFGGPLSLNSSQFKAVISGETPVFVKFFAPWCGHCKKLAPTWNELSAVFPETTVLIAKVDCTVETSLCSEEGIKGYPTLKLYIGANQIRYSGHRDLASLESFIREHTVVTKDSEEVSSAGEGLIELNSNNFGAFIERKGVQFIKFYAPWCGHCQKLAPVWSRLANIYKTESSVGIGQVDCTVHSQLCTKYGVQGYPTLIMFGGGIPLDKYNGERDLKNLNDFVREQIGEGEEEGEEGGEKNKGEGKSEIVEEEEEEKDGINNNGPQPLSLTEDNFDKVIEEGLTFVKFFAPWCGHCQEMAGTWDELAKVSHATTRTTIAKVDCTVEKTLCNRYNIDGYPTLLLFSEGIQKVEYTSARDLESLLNFLKQNEE